MERGRDSGRGLSADGFLAVGKAAVARADGGREGQGTSQGACGVLMHMVAEHARRERHVLTVATWMSFMPVAVPCSSSCCSSGRLSAAVMRAVKMRDGSRAAVFHPEELEEASPSPREPTKERARSSEAASGAPEVCEGASSCRLARGPAVCGNAVGASSWARGAAVRGLRIRGSGSGRRGRPSAELAGRGAAATRAMAAEPEPGRPASVCPRRPAWGSRGSEGGVGVAPTTIR
jgi:hypothetical protein